jgi:hypothetical protein
LIYRLGFHGDDQDDRRLDPGVNKLFILYDVREDFKVSASYIMGDIIDGKVYNQIKDAAIGEIISMIYNDVS